MIISIINHTNGKLSDEEVQHALRAINCQISRILNLTGAWGRRSD